jgi:tetratricopeptide (TPR) repeat protein
MAKVSLRIYNREIESLVDQGNTDEAIAHCRHILKTFPKHLETYRLLGKAYLEARRYGEAVDIFSRILMSVPDDFVSHVGMSIINDEQNRLDNAIWHMERAFEVQAANAAIQGELQRLYARRDGMEPPKIRMTRGALAHMYVQGELYPQAIAEVRAVLGQDPQRTDMQVLLAKAYFRAGQKADASDMCAQLLKKSPYCFDANRIMVELLPSTAGAAESTQTYRMRVGELDPYATLSNNSVFRSAEVADAAINLDRLEYTGQEVPIGQEWSSSLGIKLGDGGMGSSSSDNQPDWLKNAGTSEPQNDIFGSSSSTNQNAQASEEIPDFLRAAGWGESTGPEQPSSIFDAPDAAANMSNEDLVSASIPDWLKGQMPNDPAPTQDAAPTADMDWLNGLSAAAAQNAQPINHGDMPDWLSGSSNENNSVEQPSTLPSSDVPDWLSGLGSVDEQPSSTAASGSDWPVNDDSASSVKSADVPDWLSGLGSTESQPATPATDTPDWLSGASDEKKPAVESADVPDWLAGLGDAESSNVPASAQSGDVPDWLSGLDTPEPAADTNIEAKIETPDWLSGFDEPVANNAPVQPAANIETLGASAQEQDDAVAWLESLAAKHGAKPEELVTDPNKRSETAPEWVQQATVANETQSTPQPAPTQPAATIESLGASAQEQDDAVAWLESLAAKHGAKPEELVTDPNKRSETAPDWVQQASAIGESQPETKISEPVEDMPISETAKNIGEQFFAEFETASTAEPAMDQTGMWLKSLDEKETQDEVPASEGNIPDWLAGDSQQGLDKNDFVSENLSQDDLSNWLSNLEDDDVQPAMTQSAPSSKQDLPDWLSGVDDKVETEQQGFEPVRDSQPASVPAEEPVLSTPPADLPDWLQGVDEETQPIADDDESNTPPWLHRESWEAEERTIEPTPIKPSDWHPIETVEQAPVKEEPKKVAPAPVQQTAPVQPVQQTVAAQPKPQAPKAQPKKAAKQEPQGVTAVLTQAKNELDRGDIPAALEHYGKLIKKGKHLEETISDLTDSLYRYPVEVGIWQTLGDAYMRANRLKEALESYNKAEELIR